MANIFLISDTHFGHANILNFKYKDAMGIVHPMREFKDVNHMNEHMIACWNEIVRPQDKVYHLGDIAMNPKDIPIIARCNGHKRLVLGNHDPKVMKLLTPYFEAIYSSRQLDKLFLTHIPIHPESMGKCLANVHGHVHNNVPQLFFGPKYYNVSVEVLDYKPIALETLQALLRKRNLQAPNARGING